MVADPFASDDEFQLKRPPLEGAVYKAAEAADKQMPNDVKKEIADAVKTLSKGNPGDSQEFRFPNAKVAKKFAEVFSVNQDVLSATAKGSSVLFIYPKKVSAATLHPHWSDPLEERVGQKVCEAFNSYDPDAALRTQKGLPTPAVQAATEFFSNFIREAQREKADWNPSGRGSYYSNSLELEAPKLAKALLDRLKPLLEKELGTKVPTELAGVQIKLGKEAPKEARVLNIE